MLLYKYKYKFKFIKIKLMKNILVKSVNTLSSMTDVISGINININKNVLTPDDIILLNEKI
jgi:hypothetical protein